MMITKVGDDEGDTKDDLTDDDTIYAIYFVFVKKQLTSLGM